MMTSTNEFWQWFSGFEARLFENPESPEAWRELDERLTQVHPGLSWELGPAGEGRMYFAVSPSLDNELVPVASALVAQAGPSERWNVVVGRQRRPWASVTLFMDDSFPSLQAHAVDLSTWRHIAFKVKGTDKLDVVFECGSALALDDAELDQIGTVLAMGLLGELVVMERVDAIEVVPQLEERWSEKAKPAHWLAYAFGMKPL